MARFRFKGLHDGCTVAASGYLAVGFTSLHFVAPGDEFEVSDVKGIDGGSDADSYRVCPALYEELPGDVVPVFPPVPTPPLPTPPIVTEPEDELL
ncbi:MAG: hypothetical protein ACLP1E_07705 [Acidimicrobiales bacterium]